jgi:hypothetical protein
MTYQINKPEGTFYTDYVIDNGKCYIIFEHDRRQTTKFVCHTDKFSCDKLTETQTTISISI